MKAGYIEPNRASRLKLALLVAAGLAVNVAMELWWSPFMDFVRTLSTCESLPWLRVIVMVFTLLVWLAGASVIRAARLTLQSGQSPFPGALVWSRTKIKTGWRAKVDGYAYIALGAMCLIGPVVVWLVVDVASIFCMPNSCGC